MLGPLGLVTRYFQFWYWIFEIPGLVPVVGCKYDLQWLALTAAGSRCDSCCSCGSYCSAAGCRTIQYQVQGRTGLEKVKLKMQMVKNNTGLNIMFKSNVDYKDILALVDMICIIELWRLRCATIARRESASLLQCPIHPWRCSGELTAVVQWGESCSHGHTAVNQTYYLVTRTPRRWCFNHCFVPVTNSEKCLPS